VTSPASTVLFDIDGTLVDTNHLHTLAWCRAFREHDYQVAAWRVHRMIGAGSSVLMDALIGTSDASVQVAWREHFERLAGDIVAFPGAAELIGAVRDRGERAVLATSSPAGLVDLHLEALGITRDDVDAVTSDDDVEVAKPEPDVFCTALAAVDGTADRAVVLGDSIWDMTAAKRANLTAIGVRSGGTHPTDLRRAGAALVYDDVAHLLRCWPPPPKAGTPGVQAGRSR
jgi:HAD superfamily hydrolase (TIGR01509 family)